MTYWFPQRWRGRFVANFMAAIPLANIIGGPLSTSILEMDGVLGLHGWQWMFILEGLPAAALAFAALKLLPDRPATASWLTAEEKKIIAERLASEERGHEHRDFWPALRDPRVIALGLVLLRNQVGLYGIQLWLPQIVRGMGYSNFSTGFVVAMCFIAAMIMMIVWGRRSDRTGERIWHVAIPLSLAAIGLFVAAFAPNDIVVLVALAVSMIGVLSYNGPFFMLPSTFLGGVAAAGGIGMINTIGSLGRFIGPWGVGVLREESGGYASGMMALAIAAFLAAAIVVVMGRMMGARRKVAPAE
jgi:ACS family tartrate transporter-like MFS transporter